MKRALSRQYTEVEAVKTIAEIQQMLSEAGAEAVLIPATGALSTLGRKCCASRCLNRRQARGRPPKPKPAKSTVAPYLPAPTCAWASCSQARPNAPAPSAAMNWPISCGRPGGPIGKP